MFAYDVATGKQLAKSTFAYPNYSGVALTPGLVWAGQIDGTFAAYDTKTLQPKWSINIGNSIRGAADGLCVNGKEYVAIMAGPSTTGLGFDELKNLPADNMLYVFSL